LLFLGLVVWGRTKCPLFLYSEDPFSEVSYVFIVFSLANSVYNLCSYRLLSIIIIAILCSGSHDVPFMADEAAASVVPSLGRLTYSLKQYLTYARLLQEKASRFNSGGQHHTLTVLP
jgi:hypothetical protein